MKRDKLTMSTHHHPGELLEELQLLRTALEEKNQIIEAKSGEIAKLRAIETWYNAIFENTGTGTLLLDEDTAILRANLQFTNIYGYTKDEIEGRSWTSLVDEEDVERMKRYHAMRRVDPDSAPKSYVFKLIDKYRQHRYVHITIDMIPETKVSVASLLDITHRIASEKALEVSEKKYRLLVENMNDGLIMRDRDGTISYANRRASAIMGHPLNEIIGHPMNDFINGDFQESSLESFRDEIQGGINRSHDQYEITWKGKDGTRTHTIMSPRMIEDDDGNFSGSFGIITDITKRKEAENALRFSEEMFSKAFRSSPVAIMITTLEDGIFIDANESFMRITGYRRDEVIGTSMQELNFWPDSEYHDQLMLRLRNNGSLSNYDIVFRMKTGDIHYGISSAERIEIGGKKCVLFVLADITEQKRLEEEILRISENERRKIGQDLHDDLQQHLIGMEALASSLFKRLSQEDTSESLLSREIYDLTVTAIEKTRKMARGLCPVYLDENALDSAINEFAGISAKHTGYPAYLSPAVRYPYGTTPPR